MPGLLAFSATHNGLIGARLRANKPAHIHLAGLAILKLGGPNWMIGIVGCQLRRSLALGCVLGLALPGAFDGEAVAGPLGVA